MSKKYDWSELNDCDFVLTMGERPDGYGVSACSPNGRIDKATVNEIRALYESALDKLMNNQASE